MVERRRVLSMLLGAAVVAGSLVLGAAPQPASAAIRPVPVTAGDAYTCALTAQGGVQCWGANDSGQLGDGTTTPSTVPVDVLGLTSGVVAIDAGSKHTCAVKTTGAVRCWGNNAVGQLGDGRTVNATVPVAVQGMGTGTVAVTAGGSHSCAIKSSGAAWCWGRNAYGQLGDGTKTDSPVPIEVAGLAAGTRSISAGSAHTCAVTPGGGATCWGRNLSGEAGGPGTGNVLLPTAVTGATSGVSSVVAGGSHTCAQMDSTGVRCWGSNGWSQLGSAGSDARTAIDVPGVTGVTELALGQRHSCAVASGQVSCWGDNEFAQAGVDALRRSSPITVVPQLSGVIAVAAGENHTCALSQGGALSCFGQNGGGQLGTGTRSAVPSPKQVAGLPEQVTQVSSRGQHTCALTAAGAVRCWGDNQYGTLGTGAAGQSTASASAAAVAVPSLTSGVKAVAAGAVHTCALSTAGAVSCWGSPASGQIGDGTVSTTEVRPSPVPVTGLESGVTAIGVGDHHSCAVTAAGGAVCWGRNLDGQLGNGTVTKSAVPVPVSGLSSGVKAVAGGATHSCAITTAGALWCWGNNEYGQLGDFSQTDSLVPVPVTGLDQDVTAVALGTDHTCAVVAGLTRCWGLGASGRLGQGTTAGSMLPLPPEQAAGPGLVVSAGTDHACTADATGALRCWGGNADGQVGNGTLTQQPQPVIVPGMASGVTSVAAGLSRTCAARSTGGVWCWGNNVEVRLGIGARQAVTGGAVFYAGKPALWYPFASWSALVRQVYYDITAKPPTSTELSTWVAALTAGTKTKGDLADALRKGPDNLANVDATARLYRAFLGRAPDRSGLEFWIGRRRAGTWTLVRMADSFAASSEFKRKYGTLSNRAFVTLIYTDVMGRTADPGGVAYWTGQLDSGRRSRGAVMVGFSESSEYKRKQAANTDAVIASVFLLRRTPTADETVRWTTLQGAGVTNATLMLEVLDSQAYATRILG